jgi:tetratricopeptide (TPR) repeat protein
MRHLVCVVLLVCSQPAIGQQQAKDPANCRRAAATPAVRIAACTRLLRQVGDNDAQRAAILVGRGNAYFASGAFDQALQDYNAAIRMDDRVALYYFNKGAVLSKLGRYRAAIKAYSLSIRENPWDAEAYNNRAWAHMKLGKLAAALNDAERALRLQDDLADAFDTRGHIFLQMGRLERAVADFRAALRLKPGMRSAINGLHRANTASQ